MPRLIAALVVLFAFVSQAEAQVKPPSQLPARKIILEGDNTAAPNELVEVMISPVMEEIKNLIAVNYGWRAFRMKGADWIETKVITVGDGRAYFASGEKGGRVKLVCTAAYLFGDKTEGLKLSDLSIRQDFISRDISIGGEIQPPLPPPVPDPTPLVKGGKFFVIVVRSLDMSNPKIESIIANDEFRDGLKAKGHIFRAIVPTSAAAKEAGLEEWITEAGGTPALILMDADASTRGKVRAAVRLPNTEQGILDEIRKAGGS